MTTDSNLQLSSGHRLGLAGSSRVKFDAKQAMAADQFVAKGAWVSHLVLVSLTAVMEPPMFGVMEPQTGE
jgi:hypothetical protein